MAIDPKALDGSAYASLGSLFYQVPGWPIGFGDDKKAAESALDRLIGLIRPVGAAAGVAAAIYHIKRLVDDLLSMS